MSLFQTGFKVDASVPVASTSTAAHTAAGSAHKKRKRGSNAATATEGLLSAQVTSGQPNSSSKDPAQSSPKGKSEEIDIYRMLEGSTAATSSKQASTSAKTSEAVVNIEKLMKKLERMEKGAKAEKAGSISSPAGNKKQKIDNEKNSKPPNAGQKSSIEKGKGTDASSTANTMEAATSSTIQNGAAESTKAKNKKNKKKKDAESAQKVEYVPDEAALAKREARRLKKENQLLSKKPSSAVLQGNGDGQDKPSAGDESTMHIDILESANPVADSVPEGQAGARQTKNKGKGKKAAATGEISTVKLAGQQHAPSVQEDSQVNQTSPKKKEKLKQNQVEPIVSPAKESEAGMTELQKRMQKKLGGARFRWINEQLVSK